MQAQVKQTTQAINRLHNLLARVFPELATLTDDIAAGWVLRAARQVSHRRTHRPGPPRFPGEDPLPRRGAGRAAAPGRPAIGRLAARRRGRGAGPRSGRPRSVTASRPRSRLRQLLERRLRRPARLAPTSRSSPSPASARPPPPSWSPRSWTSTASPRPTTWSATSASFPRRTAPASTSRASPCPPARCACRRKGNDLVRSYLWNAARVRHPPQPGHPRPLSPPQGQGQARRRRHRPLHAQAAPPRLRRLEDRSPLRRAALPLGDAGAAPARLPDRPPNPATATAPTPASVVAGSAAAASNDVADGNAANDNAPPVSNETAVGHKRDVPATEVVTTATATVCADAAACQAGTASVAENQRCTDESQPPRL